MNILSEKGCFRLDGPFSLALGPGEVGAPVFDLNGRFVGMTHAALPDLQSSFCSCQSMQKNSG